jgi:two-component system sensor histidine kinase AlgZ
MPEQSTTTSKETFLPDFCHIRIVFSVVIIAELLSFILTLATPSQRGGDWGYLSLVSMFIQWIALSSAALLCWLRPRLRGVADDKAAVIAYTLLLLVTALFSELAFQISRYFGAGAVQIEMSHIEFFLRNLAICAIVSLMTLRYFYLQHQLKLNIEAENQSRLLALQARIRPHFLFNALNTITSLIRHQPQRAEEAVEDLSDLFRHTLNNAEARLPFSTEMEIARRYLDMEQLRLGERLTVTWEIDAMPEDASLPALTLQPLLENAVCHGIEPLSRGGTINVSARRKGNTLSIRITNPLPGEEQDIQRKRQGMHIALDNTRQRLQAHFSDEGSLTSRKEGDYYQVDLRFPYQPYQHHEDTDRR